MERLCYSLYFNEYATDNESLVKEVYNFVSSGRVRYWKQIDCYLSVYLLSMLFISVFLHLLTLFQMIL